MGSLEEVPQAKLWRALAAQLKRLAFIYLFFNLALLLLSCGLQDLRSIVWDLLLCHVGAQVLEHVSFSSCVTEA